MDIKDRINKLPDSPGVYLMKDKQKRIIYIGKAASLKKRVSSYFTGVKPSYRIGLMISEVNDIDYIPANSEAEALIYEASLIKAEQPKYNVELKDDKSYPYLKLTLNERYPRLIITRKIIDDGSRYYGPYTNVKLLKQALTYMRSIFPLKVRERLGKSPSGRRIAKEIMLFLEGRRQELLDGLSLRMEKASKRLDFEEAMRIRNSIKALSTMVTKRGVPSPMDQIDELKFILNLRRRPKRIEAFDVSNIRGKEAAGSMVSFYDGRPDKTNYRRYRIKTVKKIDDYKMIREVVQRRYRRLLDEKKGLPDLIIIDGGRGHLSSAVGELRKLGITHIPAIGIAKEFEHIYLPQRELPIILPKDSSVLQLIKRIRDEAHRFAIRYHTTLRKKKMREGYLAARRRLA